VYNGQVAATFSRSIVDRGHGHDPDHECSLACSVGGKGLLGRLEILSEDLWQGSSSNRDIVFFSGSGTSLFFSTDVLQV
jgi:hypothetical protein